MKSLITALVLVSPLLGTTPQESPKTPVISRLRADLPVLTSDRIPALPNSPDKPVSNERWLDKLYSAAKKGRLPAHLVEDGLTQVSAKVDAAPGWKAFLVLVPASQTIKVDLEHPEAAFFRLEPLDEFANLKGTAFLSHGPAGQPRLTLKNRLSEPVIAVITVQDPGRRSAQTPFKLTFERSWKEGSVQMKRPKDSRFWALVPLAD